MAAKKTPKRRAPAKKAAKKSSPAKKKAVAKKPVAKKPVAKKKAVAPKPVAKKKAVAKKPPAKKRPIAKSPVADAPKVSRRGSRSGVHRAASSDGPPPSSRPAPTLAEVRAAAEAGLPEAQLELGRVLFWSEEGDPVEAVQWLERASVTLPEALYVLGFIYYQGRGPVLADPARSRALHHAAAEAGIADAQFELSIYLDKGIGGAVDRDGARVWERRAADQSHPRACLNLAVWAATGKYGPVDMERAVDWYGRAADNGSAEAASRLAIMYLHGVGVPKDDERGRAWFEQAASLGYDWTTRMK